LESFGDLEEVGDDLNISMTKLVKFSDEEIREKIKVGGKIKRGLLENNKSHNILKESKDKIMTIPAVLFLDKTDVILDNYKKKGFDGIKVLGGLNYSQQDKDFDIIFDNVVEVGGYLDLNYTNIKSLGNLEYVNGNLFLIYCRKLESLGKLKYVGRNLFIDSSLLVKLSDKEIRSQVEIKGEIIRN
jgi:hypothetical protein